MTRMMMCLAALVLVAPMAGAEEPAPVAEVSAPAVPAGFVFRPEFTVAGQTHVAGTAFALRVGGKTLVVTSHQMFGPAGGLPAQLTGAQLAEQFEAAVLRDAYSELQVTRVSKPVLLPDAEPLGKSAVKDLAAFYVPTASGFDSVRLRPGTVALKAGTLASEPPKVGDKVWLAAALVEGEGQLHAAKVGQIDKDNLFYEFEEKLDLLATVGAPVLNAAGEVVGVQVGTGALKDGTLIGSANPASAVKERLEAALTAP